MLNSYKRIQQRQISDVVQDLFVHPFISGNLSTNRDIETKHAPAVLVTIYKRNYGLLKRVGFRCFINTARENKCAHLFSLPLCLHFFLPVFLVSSYRPYSLLICPSISALCVWLWNIYLSIHTSILILARLWRVHTPLLAHLLGAGGLVKASCLQTLLPTKISYRFTLISACCCCTPANETVCDHRTALSTLERRLPRRCLTLCAGEGRHI